MTCNRCMKLAAWSLPLVLAGLAYSFGQAGQQPGKELTRSEIMSKGKFQSPAICLDCHSLPTQNRIGENALDFAVLLTEYA